MTIEQVLEALGFTPHKTLPGFYYHEDFSDSLFDFEHASFENLSKMIFDKGFSWGVYSTKIDVSNKYKEFTKSFLV